MHRVISAHLAHLAKSIQTGGFGLDARYAPQPKSLDFFGMGGKTLRNYIPIAKRLWKDDRFVLTGDIPIVPMLDLLMFLGMPADDLLNVQAVLEHYNSSRGYELKLIVAYEPDDAFFSVRMEAQTNSGNIEDVYHQTIPSAFRSQKNFVVARHRFDLLLDNPLLICFSVFKSSEPVVISASALRLHARDMVSASKFVFKLFNAALYDTEFGESVGQFFKGPVNVYSDFYVPELLAHNVPEVAKGSGAFLLDVGARSLSVTHRVGNSARTDAVYTVNDRDSASPYQISNWRIDPTTIPGLEKAQTSPDVYRVRGLEELKKLDNHFRAPSNTFSKKEVTGDLMNYFIKTLKVDAPPPLVLVDFFSYGHATGGYVLQLLNVMTGEVICKIAATELQHSMFNQQGGVLEAVDQHSPVIDQLIFKDIFERSIRKEFVIKRTDGEKFTLWPNPYDLGLRIYGLKNDEDRQAYFQKLAAETTDVREIRVRPVDGRLSDVQGYLIEFEGVR